MSHAFKALPVAAALAGMAFAGSAMAQLTSAEKAQTATRIACLRAPFCVYDSRGTPVGVPDGGSELLRPIYGSDGKVAPYELEYDSTGFGDQRYYYFTQPNCAGQPYLFVGSGISHSGAFALELTQRGEASNTNGIAIPSGPASVIRIASEGPAPGADCVTYDPSSNETILAQPAVIGDTTIFYPPLTVRPSQ